MPRQPKKSTVASAAPSLHYIGLAIHTTRKGVPGHNCVARGEAGPFLPEHVLAVVVRDNAAGRALCKEVDLINGKTKGGATVLDSPIWRVVDGMRVGEIACEGECPEEYGRPIELSDVRPMVEALFAAGPGWRTNTVPPSRTSYAVRR